MPTPTDPAAQLDALWQNLSAEPYPEGQLPQQVANAWERRRLFSVGFNRVSFDHEGTEMPAGRTKLIHRFGTCARARWVPDDDATGATGLLNETSEVLLRVSDADGDASFKPAVALMFFVEGGAPQNLLCSQWKHREKGDYNPLTVPFSNAAAGPVSFPEKLVEGRFQKTAEAVGGKRLYGAYLPLHHLVGVSASGAEVAEPTVPDRVELHATEAAKSGLTEARDFRDKLSGLDAGTPLFDVRVASAIDAESTPLGQVVLTTGFVASAYGDDQLFFRHHPGPV